MDQALIITQFYDLFWHISLEGCITPAQTLLLITECLVSGILFSQPLLISSYSLSSTLTSTLWLRSLL